MRCTGVGLHELVMSKLSLSLNKQSTPPPQVTEHCPHIFFFFASMSRLSLFLLTAKGFSLNKPGSLPRHGHGYGHVHILFMAARIRPRKLSETYVILTPVRPLPYHAIMSAKSSLFDHLLSASHLSISSRCIPDVSRVYLITSFSRRER